MRPKGGRARPSAAARGGGLAALDAAMFNITISRAADVARRVGESPSAVVFLGDALVTAHYRCG